MPDFMLKAKEKFEVGRRGDGTWKREVGSGKMGDGSDNGKLKIENVIASTAWQSHDLSRLLHFIRKD